MGVGERAVETRQVAPETLEIEVDRYQGAIGTRGDHDRRGGQLLAGQAIEQLPRLGGGRMKEDGDAGTGVGPEEHVPRVRADALHEAVVPVGVRTGDQGGDPREAERQRMRDVAIPQPPLGVRTPTDRMIGRPRHADLVQPVPLPIGSSAEQDSDHPGFGIGQGAQGKRPSPVRRHSTVSKWRERRAHVRLRPGAGMEISWGTRRSKESVMKSIGRAATVVASIVLVVLMVFVLTPSMAAGSTGAATASAPTGQWAYGYLHNYPVGPKSAFAGWTYEGNVVIGYSVILSESPSKTNASVFELTVHRTMGVQFSVKFCSPSCSSPTEYAYLFYRAWETTDSFANLTTAGTVVLQNGSSVGAVALLNSSSLLRANLTETSSSALLSPGGGLIDRSAYLSANVTSLARIAFTPSLGLFPLAAGPNSTGWSSSSAFGASGSFSFAYYHFAEGPLGNGTIARSLGPYTITPSGNVTLFGNYTPSETQVFSGITYPALQLTIVSNTAFSVREGFILVPAQADLFGSASEPWSGNESGISQATMAALDVRPLADGTVNGHIGIGASRWNFASSTANPAEGLLGSSTMLGSTMGPLTASPSATGTQNTLANTPVQGSPEQVNQATINNQCLLAGLSCPTASGTGPVRNGLLTVGALAVVATIIAAVLIVAVSERRRLPPPAYPNARLYPPGAAGTAPPKPGSPTPSRPEDDPLDHLW